MHNFDLGPRHQDPRIRIKGMCWETSYIPLYSYQDRSRIDLGSVPAPRVVEARPADIILPLIALAITPEELVAWADLA